jgi:4-aminobutyrate aminotransferase/(S)-3-amino-2-methylpropionate transaminase
VGKVTREKQSERSLELKLGSDNHKSYTAAIPKELPSEWIRREEESLAIPLRRNKELVISRASGVEIIASNGKRFLDFTGGAHVCNLGYAHPKIVDATRKQIEKLDFAAPFNGLVPIRVQLAEKIKEFASPSLRSGRLAYTNSGSESAEFSIKLARYLTKRKTILTFAGGYHGGTMGALSLTVDSSKLRKSYGPFLPDVLVIPFPNCYRGNSKSGDNCGRNEIEEIYNLFETNVLPDEVAAVFVEPIQAHGGVLIPPVDFMQALRDICTKYGILLIVDEVVTGFGRTGKMYGIHQFGIEPDVMFFGKPMGAGLPLGGILARSELMDKWTPDGPASTVAGNLLACARSLAMIETIHEERILDNVETIGGKIRNHFLEISRRVEQIGDVRGRGLLIGVELVENARTKRPLPELASNVVNDAYEKGLLITVSGIHKNVLKITPPLVLTVEDAQRGLDIISDSILDRI